MEYIVNKPYPEVKVEKENIYYATLLIEDYSGINSEYTSISKYVYEHIDKFKENQKFSKVLSEIAMVEMRHLNILGKIIKLLGLEPKFNYNINGYMTSWNSSLINYNTNIIDMLLDNIRIEKIAIANYEYHMSLIKDKYINDILKRIIEDEIKHVECFKELLHDELTKCN